MAASLTEGQVKKAIKDGCPAEKAHVMLWDGKISGFGLKIRSSGTATWIMSYRPKGMGRKVSARTITIGTWPKVGVDAARDAAQAHMGEVAKGRDPAMELRAERDKPRKLLPAVLDQYEATLERRGIVNVKTIMSTLRRGLEPLEKHEVDKITRGQVVEQIDALEAAGKPGAASDLRKHSRTLLEWAVSKGLLTFNPMAGLRRPRATRAERLVSGAKGRALSDAELVSVWTAAGRMGVFGGIVRLGLLTAMRRGELAGLQWSDVHEDRIVLHAGSTKTGTRHEIPLTKAMRAVLSAQPRQAGSNLVFGSTRAPGSQVSGWSKYVAKLVAASKVDMTLHDLRRTCRTLMSKCGVAESIAELAIGHVRSDLVATYNKDGAWDERVKAFDAVSDHVSKLLAVSPDPVTAGAEVVALAAASKKRVSA